MMPLASFASLPRRLRFVLAGLALLALSACGFHLKGATPLPFQTIYTNINLDSEFGALLRRTVTANSPGTRFTERRLDADVFLHQITESQNLRQLSLDADGRVEEYELTLDFQFELLDRQGHLLLPPTSLLSVRELPYNDRIVQAKEGEIERTFRDMRNGLVDQIMRRMSSSEVQAAYANAIDRPIVPMPDDTVRGATAPAGPAPSRP
ncbi:MAG: LPS assembly lipoprotein LptE [Castellaniella sp.]|uniref:LPS-assembly lipoprotein LptE n=1 Tax=Castellaniella sp. TaxID=1955812 RepID=UPI003C754410